MSYENLIFDRLEENGMMCQLFLFEGEHGGLQKTKVRFVSGENVIFCCMGTSMICFHFMMRKVKYEFCSLTEYLCRMLKGQRSHRRF